LTACEHYYYIGCFVIVGFVNHSTARKKLSKTNWNEPKQKKQTNNRFDDGDHWLTK